jgi:uncharacterized alkaline shock family protein YloU
MSQVKLAVGVMLYLFLAACGSSSQFVKPMENSVSKQGAPKKYLVGNFSTKVDSVPDHFLSAIKGFLKVELKEKGLYVDNESDPANVIDVEVNYYRMRSGFTRMFWGMLAGKDGVDSTVKITDTETQSIVGEMTVSSFNVAAIGESEDVARMHAEEIAETLEKAGKPNEKQTI